MDKEGEEKAINQIIYSKNHVANSLMTAVVTENS